MKLSREQVDVVSMFSDTWIQHDQTLEALDEISNFHEVNRSTTVPTFMVLMGETGTGKSSIVARYLEQFEISEVRKQVLYVIVPEKCSKKDLVHNILVALGDPKADQGTRGNMQTRLPLYTKALGVEMIILDEFQHLIERRNNTIREEVADWVKTQGDILGIPFLLVGLPEIESILSVNKQLARRVSKKQPIEKFSIATDEERKKFGLLLYFIDRQLPFAERSDLLMPAVMQALLSATGGLIGYIMRLVRRGVELALLKNADALLQSHLADAYQELGGPEHLDSNPFESRPRQKGNLNHVGKTNIRGRRKKDADESDE